MPTRSNLTASEKAADAAVRISTACILFYLVVPIFVIVPLSFTSGSLLVLPIPSFSIKWYEDFATNPLWTQATFNSVVIALVTMVLATALGTTAALGLNRASPRIRRLVSGLLVTPLVIPLVITAVAFFYFLSALGLVGTFSGLIIAHTLLALPFVVITVTAALKNFDANLVRASASLGAAPLLTFRRVTLPLIFPGILSGAVFAFVTSFDEIVIAIFLGTAELRTLPRQIFSGATETVTPTIAAAAVILLVSSISLMAVVELLRRYGERRLRPASLAQTNIAGGQ
jgi:putative spermidine/putrescine transport system permease protein